ncbi:MAG: hypothetical protein JOZ07_06285 [Solirubrobacterales bacterium]|nr:hypothetical protein [Solirubrobacterales bacterium]
MAVRLRILGVALVALVIASPAFAGAALPVLPGSPSVHYNIEPLVRPVSIEYAGDGSGALGGFDGHGRNRFGHLTWTKWTTEVAIGHGANWVDDCMPACADGIFHPYLAELTAFRPRDGHFTRLRVRSGRGPNAVTFTLAVQGSGRHLIYQDLPG